MKPAPLEQMFDAKKGFYLLLFLIPFYLELQWLMGWHILSRFWHNLLILSLFSALFFRYCLDAEFRRVRFNLLDGIAAAGLGYGLFQVWHSYLQTNWFTALNGFRMYYFGLILYFVVRFLIRDRKELKKVSVVLFVLTFAACLEQIVEFILLAVYNTITILPWVEGGPDGLGAKVEMRIFHQYIRPYGLLGGQQTSAIFISIGLSISAIFYINKERSTPEGRWFVRVFYIMIASLFLTTSRTGIFSFLIVFFVMILFFSKFTRKLSIVSGLLLICAALFSVENDIQIGQYNLNQVAQYIVPKKSDPYFGAFKLAEEEEDTSVGAYLVGAGFNPGAFEGQIGLKISHKMPGYFGLSKHHSALIHFFQLNGIIGGCLLLAQFFLAYSYGRRFSKKEQDPFLKTLYTGFAFAVLAVFISMAHYPVLTNPAVQTYFYCILGILGALPSLFCKKTESIS